jgi:peptide/nickel transport system permease protein
LTKYVVRRLALLAPTLLGISLLVFGLMRLLPGDVVQVMLGTEAQLGPEQRQTLYRLFGLDVPLPLQYLRWLLDLARGDLGVSLRTAEPVTRIIARRLPITVELAGLAALLSWLVAVPLGAL